MRHLHLALSLPFFPSVEPDHFGRLIALSNSSSLSSFAPLFPLLFFPTFVLPFTCSLLTTPLYGVDIRTSPFSPPPPAALRLSLFLPLTCPRLSFRAESIRSESLLRRGSLCSCWVLTISSARRKLRPRRVLCRALGLSGFPLPSTQPCRVRQSTPPQVKSRIRFPSRSIPSPRILPACKLRRLSGIAHYPSIISNSSPARVD